jgi:hypothetical protein
MLIKSHQNMALGAKIWNYLAVCAIFDVKIEWSRQIGRYVAKCGNPSKCGKICGKRPKTGQMPHKGGNLVTLIGNTMQDLPAATSTTDLFEREYETLCYLQNFVNFEHKLKKVSFLIVSATSYQFEILVLRLHCYSSWWIDNEVKITHYFQSWSTFIVYA